MDPSLSRYETQQASFLPAVGSHRTADAVAWDPHMHRPAFSGPERRRPPLSFSAPDSSFNPPPRIRTQLRQEADQSMDAPDLLGYPPRETHARMPHPHSAAVAASSYGAGEVGASTTNINRHTTSATRVDQQAQLLFPPHFEQQHHHLAFHPFPANAGEREYESADIAEHHGLYSASRYTCDDRDTPWNTVPSSVRYIANNKVSSPRSTLWWGELEAWMDEEYAKQVCNLMGWDSVTVKIPHTGPDPATGQQSNNPGYCFLTFPTPQQAANVLTQINNPASGGPVTMPNSAKPFTLNWASSPATSPATASFPPPLSVSPAPTLNANQQQKEYSIFVGDLAPETSNSDLVAVFRNPVLGLRNDRAPKFIRPFYSCKSAKIMLDPATGVSRGYGFVRFTDEADQQRALIEMHGLYCLSRPMRISPATAKYKTAPAPPSNAAGSHCLANDVAAPFHQQSLLQPGILLGPHHQHLSVSSINATSSVSTSGSGSSIGSLSSVPSLTTSTTATSVSSQTVNADVPAQNLSLDVLAQLFAKASMLNDSSGLANARNAQSITAPLVQDSQQSQNYGFANEDAWKHTAQARAILSNLIGPNGEQLTSTDPYNTTVFVGGLSPLISEETLRTFFAPFGEIHYVKVPVGKHCGFVQFVRKADAERAIDRMQGFPIGGSRIRLSWGRSQYKAAQAAAQAAVAAQTQAMVPQTGMLQITPEQALDMLQKFGFTGSATETDRVFTGNYDMANTSAAYYHMSSSGAVDSQVAQGSQPVSHFSPFSPDPNFLASGAPDRGTSLSVPLPDGLAGMASGNTARFAHASGMSLQPSMNSLAGVSDEILSLANARSPTPASGLSSQPQHRDAFGFSLNRSAAPFQLNRTPGRPTSSQEVPVCRPSSAQNTQNQQGKECGHDQEPIDDVNGTLASLNLDQSLSSPGSIASPDQGNNHNDFFVLSQQAAVSVNKSAHV